MRIGFTLWPAYELSDVRVGENGKAPRPVSCDDNEELGSVMRPTTF